MKHHFFIFLFLLASMQSVFAATITAQVDRNPVGLNETLTIVFEASGSPDDDPDFSPLEQDFEVLGKSQSSNISYINGDYKKSIKWNVSVYPKRAGVITIPSINFGKDRSPALKLTVQQASAQATTADFLLETEIDPKQAWVQGQIVLTLRFLSGKNLSGYGIQKPKVENIDAVIEPLDEEKQYQTQRGTKPYLVIEQRYAIFPQQVGKLRIPPIIAEARLSTGTRSMFDPFQRGETKRVRSKAIEIDVADIPKSFTGKNWLPANEVKLVEEWPENPPRFKAGEPVTRTVTLFADGLTSAQLPELTMPAVNGLKQYPDQPVTQDNKQHNAIIGIRQEKVAIIPTQAGSYTLPEITIPWFNTKTGKTEIARIAKRQIQVSAGELTQPAKPKTPQAAAIETPVVSNDAFRPEATTQTSGIWFWLSLFLASGWLLTSLAWWQKQRNQSSKETRQHKQIINSISKADKALKSACAKNDANACKDALIDWGRVLFPNEKPSSLGHLAGLAGEPLKSRIDELNQSLYSSNQPNWQSGDLWEITRQLLQEVNNKNIPPVGSLEPLYK